MALYAYTTIDVDLSPIRIYHYDLMILIQFNTAVPIWSVSSAPLRCVKISLPGWSQSMIIYASFYELTIRPSGILFITREHRERRKEHFGCLVKLAVRLFFCYDL